jgi:MFS superfamily sulfate permease-like transporter
LFGLPGGGDNFFQRLLILGRRLGDTNTTVLVIGLIAIALLAIGERFLPKQPVALLVVILSIVVVSFMGLAGHGVEVVGIIPAGLPRFGFPVIGIQHVEGVAELAFACFLLSYIESISAARTFSLKHGYPVDPRQELLGLGAANLAAAIGQGYPVAGGLSQSAVNEEAGAHTPMSLIVASSMLTMVLLFLTGLLRNLPAVVLSAIVLVAVFNFIKYSEFKRLWHISRLEFQVAMVAFGGVLFFGILKGVLFSAVASILFLLRLMANPHVATLGRIPGTERFSDVARHPHNELTPGLFMFRVEAPLLYFNVENIDKIVLARVHYSASAVKLVICDLSSSPYIDAAGAQMLAHLQEQLGREGIQFRVADAHAEVRDILRTMGVDERLGGVNRRTSIADIIDEFRIQSSPKIPAETGLP